MKKAVSKLVSAANWVWKAWSNECSQFAQNNQNSWQWHFGEWWYQTFHCQRFCRCFLLNNFFSVLLVCTGQIGCTHWESLCCLIWVTLCICNLRLCQIPWLEALRKYSGLGNQGSPFGSIEFGHLFKFKWPKNTLFFAIISEPCTPALCRSWINFWTSYFVKDYHFSEKNFIDDLLLCVDFPPKKSNGWRLFLFYYLGIPSPRPGVVIANAN